MIKFNKNIIKLIFDFNNKKYLDKILEIYLDDNLFISYKIDSLGEHILTLNNTNNNNFINIKLNNNTFSQKIIKNYNTLKIIKIDFFNNMT